MTNKYTKLLGRTILANLALLSTTALAYSAPVDGYGNALPTAATTGENYKYTNRDGNVNPDNPFFSYAGTDPDNGGDTFTLKSPLSNVFTSAPFYSFGIENPDTGQYVLQISDWQTGVNAEGFLYNATSREDSPNLMIYEGNNLKSDPANPSTFTNRGSSAAILFYNNAASGVSLINSAGGRMYVNNNTLDQGSIDNGYGGKAYLYYNSADSAKLTNHNNSYMLVQGSVANNSTIYNANGDADDRSEAYMAHSQANGATLHNYNRGTLSVYGDTLNQGTLINDANATMNVGDCSIARGCKDNQKTSVIDGTITNNGTINVSGTMEFANSTFTNNGIANVDGLTMNGGTFIITKSGVVNYTDALTTFNQSVFNIEGTANLRNLTIQNGEINITGTTNATGKLNIIDSKTNNDGVFRATDLAMTMSGKFSGAGETNFLRSTLDYNADGSEFTGTVNAQDNSTINLHKNSIIGGKVNIGSGSVLSGNGTTQDLNILNGGSVSPRSETSDIGHINVKGNMSFAKGSTYYVDIANNPAASDIIVVNGKTSIEGGTVIVNRLSPAVSYAQGYKQTILSSDGGVTGQFDDVLSNSAFLNLSTTYDDNHVYLNAGKGKNFSSVALTKNQYNTSRALDTLAQTGSSLSLNNKLLILNANDARNAFDQLSGEAYASANGVLLEESSFVRDAVFNRLSQAQGVSFNSNDAIITTKSSERSPNVVKGNTFNDFVAWANTYGSWGRRDSNGNAQSIRSSTGGFLTGIDTAIQDDWRVGVLAGYSRTTFHANNRASSGSSDNYTLGGYAGTPFEIANQPFNFRSGLSYTWHQVSMDRYISFQDFYDKSGANHDAGTFQAFGELGYEYKTAHGVIEPYANLAYVRFHSDSFKEDGSTAASLSVNSNTMDTGFSTLGVRASSTFTLGQTETSARINIGWRHAYSDITPRSRASFVGSDAYTIDGAPIAKDMAIIDTGLNFAVMKNTNLDIAYVGKFGNGTSQNGAKANLIVKF